MKRYVKFLPFLVLIFFLGIAFLYRDTLHARVEIGEEAPGFTLPLLDTGELTLESLRGKPVIVNFWTTWCQECRDETIALQSFYEKMGDKVEVIGVNMREPKPVIRRFTDGLNVTYPIVLDQLERVKRMYRVTGVPETWFIDAAGIAVGRHIGAIDETQLMSAANVLLSEDM